MLVRSSTRIFIAVELIFCYAVALMPANVKVIPVHRKVYLGHSDVVAVKLKTLPLSVAGLEQLSLR